MIQNCLPSISINANGKCQRCADHMAVAVLVGAEATGAAVVINKNLLTDNAQCRWLNMIATTKIPRKCAEYGIYGMFYIVFNGYKR